MSLSEEKQMLLSQLVDGELPVDRANEVLAEVFDELASVLGGSASARQLHDMLQLRRAIDPWRRQTPAGPVRTPHALREVDLPQPHAEHEGYMPHAKREGYRRAIGLASAAMLGGVLVAGGFFLGNRLGDRPAIVPAFAAADRQRRAVIVTPEQRREIAQAFRLHESVAGPLGWYAADDSTILLAPAGKGEAAHKPIAVVLRLERDSSCPCSTVIGPKTYVIVCRNNDPATIELPPSALANNLRLRLLPTESNGQVNVQYALAADGPDRERDGASLAGRRNVGDQTSLGQLALNDCFVNVDASAWVLGAR